MYQPPGTDSCITFSLYESGDASGEQRRSRRFRMLHLCPNPAASRRRPTLRSSPRRLRGLCSAGSNHRRSESRPRLVEAAEVASSHRSCLVPLQAWSRREGPQLCRLGAGRDRGRVRGGQRRGGRHEEATEEPKPEGGGELGRDREEEA